MREIAHGRWLIENNVFKRLNSLVGSKSKYIQNKRVKERLLLLWADRVNDSFICDVDFP
ncbi:MAG: hypothetical protein ACOYWZ_06245 [Bacillota bacterium]